MKTIIELEILIRDAAHEEFHDSVNREQVHLESDESVDEKVLVI